MAIPKKQLLSNSNHGGIKRQVGSYAANAWQNKPYGPAVLPHSRLPTLSEISYLEPMQKQSKNNDNDKKTHKKVKFPPELPESLEPKAHQKRQKPFTVFNNNNRNSEVLPDWQNPNVGQKRQNQNPQQQFSISVFSKQGGGYKINNRNNKKNVNKNVRFVNKRLHQGQQQLLRSPLQPRGAVSRRRSDF